MTNHANAAILLATTRQREERALPRELLVAGLVDDLYLMIGPRGSAEARLPSTFAMPTRCAWWARAQGWIDSKMLHDEVVARDG